MKIPDWAGSSGDLWARRWRDTDRALAPVGAELDEAILKAAPSGALRVLDVGCGPGTTSLSLAERRAEIEIVGCDLSQSLVAIAQERSAGRGNLHFVAADAEAAAVEHGPFDLIVSRHGVMFFTDPFRAFRALRAGASDRAVLVFSCFQAWEANPWAAELGSAAAGKPLPAPGREPSGFAFADPEYVGDILASSNWADAQPRALEFDYVAGGGSSAIENALSFLAELGPAARILETMRFEERDAATERMRQVIANYEQEGRVSFPAAAWIWTARAA